MRVSGWLRTVLALAAACGAPATNGREGGPGGDAAGAGAGMTPGPIAGADGSGAGGDSPTGGGLVGGATGGASATTTGGGPAPTLGRGGCGPVLEGYLCADPAMAGSPPPPPTYGGTCPMITPYNPSLGAGGVNTIQSATGARTFMVVAPDNPCPDETFPVVFLWHWISGAASGWLSYITQDLVNEFRFIAVMADGTREPLQWPFTVLDGPVALEQEYKLFDDMYACVAQQWDVNTSCIASLGVSAGGLFNSQFLQGRGQYLSSAIVISGGTGGPVMPWVGSSHKLPVIALWGGPLDTFPGFSFDVLMMDMETGLQRDGHYFIECVHNCGHAPPLLGPLMPGVHPLAPFFDFVLNHPYGLPDGGSPYKDAGKLADGFPAWCSDKGKGTAPPANIPTCPAALCASPDTPIATPAGERPIAELREGDLVYSVDHGAVVAVPLARVARTAVENHRVVRVQLANGRALEVSAGHPLAENGTFADLAPGVLLDGVEVVRAEEILYAHPFTHDILPASETGTYYAAGALIGSTLVSSTRCNALPSTER